MLMNQVINVSRDSTRDTGRATGPPMVTSPLQNWRLPSSPLPCSWDPWEKNARDTAQTHSLSISSSALTPRLDLHLDSEMEKCGALVKVMVDCLSQRDNTEQAACLGHERSHKNCWERPLPLLTWKTPILPLFVPPRKVWKMDVCQPCK